MAELSRSLRTSNPSEARARCLRATAWFRDTMEKLSRMPDPTRADLETAAIRFFKTLEQELDRPRSYYPDIIGEEVERNLEASRDRISEIDGQLITNVFDEEVKSKADVLLESLAAESNELHPELRLFSLQLAARAEREQLLKLMHLLTMPVLPYIPEDMMFVRSGFPSPVVPETALSTEASLPLREAAEAYIAKIKAKKLSASHQNELARALRWLQECTGSSRTLSSITKGELRSFRDDIERLNASLQGSSLAFKERLTSSPQQQIKSVTAKRYWQSIKSFFAWAAEEGYIDDSPALSLKVQTKKGEAKRTPVPFSSDELGALFETPLYAGYCSAKRLRVTGQLFRREGHWWAGVLLLYTGLRASEFSQLLPTDFDFGHDIPHLKIQQEDQTGAKVKSTKTSSSVRDVPLHPDLLTLGLRQLVERRAKFRPKQRVFHEFNLGVHGRTSAGMTKFWSAYLRLFGLWKPGRSTHVFRHTLTACLRANEIGDDEIGALLGHSPQTVTGGYGGAFPLSRKAKALLALDYGFDVVAKLGGAFDPMRH